MFRLCHYVQYHAGINVSNPIAECKKKKPIRNRTQNGQKGHIFLPTKKRKNFPLSTIITLTAPIKMSTKKKKNLSFSLIYKRLTDGRDNP